MKRSTAATRALVGMRFGTWTVESRFLASKKQARWVCHCDCGVRANVLGYGLVRGMTTGCISCSFIAKKALPVGTRFGRLVTIGPPHKFAAPTRNRVYYPVRCDCGNELRVERISLRAGHTRSCGCSKRALAIATRGATSADEVLTRGSVPEPNTGCQLWTRAYDSYGYGSLGFRGRSLRAHRLSYETYVGPIPNGLLVCHSCDTPACINPKHLFLGTDKENTRDSLRKGRRWFQKPRHQWPDTRHTGKLRGAGAP